MALTPWDQSIARGPRAGRTRFVEHLDCDVSVRPGRKPVDMADREHIRTQAPSPRRILRRLPITNPSPTSHTGTDTGKASEHVPRPCETPKGSRSRGRPRIGSGSGSPGAQGRTGARTPQRARARVSPKDVGPGVAATNDPEAIGLPAAEITCQCVTEHGHDCGAILPADPKLVSAHLSNEHALGGGGDSKERIACLWRHCRSRPLQQQSLIRHIVSVHLGLLRWTCPGSVTITDIFRFTYMQYFTGLRSSMSGISALSILNTSGTAFPIPPIFYSASFASLARSKLASPSRFTATYFSVTIAVINSAGVTSKLGLYTPPSVSPTALGVMSTWAWTLLPEAS